MLTIISVLLSITASHVAFEKKDGIPPTLQIRAAIATGLGAAAARAKLLADQEDREIEHLLATIIGTQVGDFHLTLFLVVCPIDAPCAQVVASHPFSLAICCNSSHL